MQLSAELTPDLIPRVLQIVLIDLVLSGDNAVVIGLAAHPLPPRQRRIAIVVGGGGALVLRITLTAIATLLLDLPLLKAIGGALLLWIAFRLLERPAVHDPDREASTLTGAIATILLADFVMSLDNVLGVAAAADGELLLLGFGLIVSMAIVMLGGGLFAGLIDRVWWLAYVGALVIAWTGVSMILDDAVVAQRIDLAPLAQWLVCGVVSVLVVAWAHLIHRRQPASPQSAR